MFFQQLKGRYVKIVYFYAPHMMSREKQAPNYMDEFVRKIMGCSDPEDVFCIPSALTQPLPVGSVIKFGTIVGDRCFEFKVTEIFTVEDRDPDVVFLELQLYSCAGGDVSPAQLLAFLKSKNEQENYHYWG